MQTDTFQTPDGLKIYTEYHVPDGDPKAVVLLVHGYGEHCGRYQHVIARLTQGDYAVYTLDHRGHGRSEGLRTYVDYMEQFVEDLKLYFDRIKAENPGKKRIVLGHSMGALISLAFTQAYQSEIDLLIISGAPVAADANVSPALIWAGKILTRVTPRLHLLPTGKPGILSSDPEVDIAWDKDPLTNKKPLRVRLGVEINNMARKVRERLPELSLPMLIMHGEDDKLVNPIGSQITYDKVSSADKTLRFYAGMRHEVMNEIQKEQVLTDIVDWLDSRV
jgi:alpha-beta hydrolase superfamily lysophospholipase